MAYDPSSLEIPSIFENPKKGWLKIWQQCTDAARNSQLEVTGREFLEGRGYFTADNYFMLRPYEYLGMTLDDWNHIHDRLFNNCLIVELDHDDRLDDPIELNCELEPVNHPVLVFQHHHGEIKDSEGAIFPQEQFNCTNDLIVFRGVFKAVPVDDSHFRLEKIWDRYYFK